MYECCVCTVYAQPRVNIEYWHMCQLVKSLVNISPPNFSYFKNKEEAYFLLTHVFGGDKFDFKKTKQKMLFMYCIIQINIE